MTNSHIVSNQSKLIFNTRLFFLTDGVTYEVDDPQENYDDIEASPEITETEAEVHDSPQTTPESIAAAPPEMVQGDDDYLVPGQDG